jgi:hypothetical protein
MGERPVQGPQLTPGDSRAFIAASAGRVSEALARRVLGLPGVLAASRAGFRAARWLTGRNRAPDV